MPQDDALTKLIEKLESGIMDLYSSGRYEEYLRAMMKFHHYSFGNVVLILMQCPNATKVAGYTTWKKDFSRNVKRNEVGIRILAPCVSKRKVLKENTDEDPESGESTPASREIYRKTQYFRIATVFDISQTEGKPLPTLAVPRLDGEVENYDFLFEKLSSVSPVPVMFGSCPGEANGYFSHTEQRIVIRENCSQVQIIKTLIHEIAHAKLHTPGVNPQDAPKRRNEKEVEAESIAYVVCQFLGIDTSDYSFGYVAGWSKGKELAELKASMDCIHSTAGEIIAVIEESTPVPEHKKQHTPQTYDR